MYYIIYKTINLVNNKIYIGYHSTKTLNDNYLGSGKALKAAIEKYGEQSFKKEILYVFPTKLEAFCKELEIVNEDFIKREDTYNIKLGGEGGWDHTWKDQRRIDGIRESFKNGRSKGWPQTKEYRSNHAKTSFKGKHHTEESKKNIGKAHLMDESIKKQRIKDYNNIEKTWGWKTILSNKWNISHTQVTKFVNKNIGV